MDILVVNDDGILSRNINVLAKILEKYGRVFVVAPKGDQSGCSNMITLRNGLELKSYGRNYYSINGTPSDCVKFALYGLNLKIDLVVSGINEGPNLGTDVIYSGTIAAATEAIINNIPSIALSCDYGSLDSVISKTEELLDYVILTKMYSSDYLLNINFPCKLSKEVLGVKITEQGQRVFKNYFEESNGLYFNKGKYDEILNNKNSDVVAFTEGYISITPISLDRTNYGVLDQLNNQLNTDESYMRMAMELATKAKGHVAPNPLVGCLIVKDQKIIGQGYHKEYGGNHAEVVALENCVEDPVGATMYVTLEPCSHYGKTPPCVHKIIESNISRVVIGMKDPNKLVSGKGIKALNENGIDVKVGLLEREIREQNKFFIKHIVSGLPYVILKSATTMDGKIATVSKKSKWITSEKSREYVHQIRNDVLAIMVGAGTVIEDNPYLTTRLIEGINPIRIVVDSLGITPVDANVYKQDGTRIFLATTQRCDFKKYKGIEVIVTKDKNGHVDLKELMEKLGAIGINSILLEGGGNLNYSSLEQGIVDEIFTFIAPKIFGGKDSLTSIEGKGVKEVDESFKLEDISIERFDDDILIKSKVKG